MKIIFSFFCFVLLFFAASYFGKEVFAITNNSGIGWAMPVDKVSDTSCGTSNSKYRFIVVDEDDQATGRPSVNLRVTSVADGSTSGNISLSSSNNYFDFCVNPSSGVWARVWGNSAFDSWDNSVACCGGDNVSARYNFCCGFKSTDPSSDRGKRVTYAIYLSDSGASMRSNGPANGSVIQTTGSTANVTFNIQNLRRLPNGGGSSIPNVFIWLQKTDGGNLPWCNQNSCFFNYGCFNVSGNPQCYQQNGGWSIGSTMNLAINSLPAGSYRWYAQMHENFRDYALCAGFCPTVNTLPITGQSDWQSFTIQQTVVTTSPTPTPVSSPTIAPSPPPTAPAVPTAGSATGVPSCLNSGATYGPGVVLSWNAVANATSYTVRLTKDVRTGGDAAFKTVGTTSTTGTGGWTAGNALVTWVSGQDLALAPGITYFYAVSAQGPGGDSGYDLVGKSAQIGPVALCAPADPTAIAAFPSCNGSNPEILFRFTDKSNNEDLFWIDVNDRPWTGPSGPSPWGFRTINRTGSLKTGGGNVISFWTVIQPLDSGDTNSSVAGSQLVPEEGKTYYWRVKAHVNGGPDSNHNYPTSSGFGTPTPPGVPVTVPICETDLQIKFENWRDSTGADPGPFKKFAPRERVTVDVVVTNASGNISPATDVYLYYKDFVTGMPDCSLSPPRVATAPPTDSAGALQGYGVPSMAGGAVYRFNAAISLDAVTGTAFGFVVPRCEFDASPWNNNKTSQTYTIGTEGFFESRSGDVGVENSVSVAVKSSAIVPPRYQSDYIIAAGSVNANVGSKNNWFLKQYSQRLAPKGGIYEYFDTKFKGKADPTCSFTGTSQFRYCSGNLTFNIVDTPPAQSVVFFVDGDLRFKKDFVLTTDSGVLFLVKGNVIVDLAVKRVDAFIVTKGTFSDSDVADSGVATEADALTVFGAVYSEKGANGFSLKRYFTSSINGSKPADIFVWDPKQFINISKIAGSSSIVWKEVAP